MKYNKINKFIYQERNLLIDVHKKPIPNKKEINSDLKGDGYTDMPMVFFGYVKMFISHTFNRSVAFLIG